jgi:type IV secretory pathway VirD2 relaxase
MSIIESEFGDALHSPVKRKRNNTGKLRSRAARVSAGAPEVMVKITGFGKGQQHVNAHLDYITRNGKVEMENDRGELFNGKDQVRGLFKEWAEDITDSKRHKNQRDTMHMILSMPEGTEPEAVRAAARAFARKNFGTNHQYVFALHTDEPHPHVHVTVKCLGFDGTRLNPRKADLQAWREDFADAMQDQGYEAEATPRRARGVVRKAENNVVRHIERGDKARPPRTSRVRAAQTKEAAEELAAEVKGVSPKARPWEDKIKARQTAVRRAWLATADALEKPKQPILYKKEPKNDRPDYAGQRAGRIRDGRKINPSTTVVRQSGVAKSVAKKQAKSVTRVRNVPRLAVVHQQRTAEMLLQPNARNRLGDEQRRAADFDVRRARAGNYGNDRADAGGRGGLAKGVGTPLDDKALAERIRGFVGAMPPVETLRHGQQNALRNRFTRAPEKSQAGSADRDPPTKAPAPAPAKDKGQER